MKNKYEVVTLCGNAKFKDEFTRIQNILTSQNKIVMVVAFLELLSKEESISKEMEDIIFDMHLRQIDMSDKIYVINPGGYVDKLTYAEIMYAEITGKEIYSSESFDFDIIAESEKWVDEAKKFAQDQIDIIRNNKEFDKDKLFSITMSQEEIENIILDEDEQPVCRRSYRQVPEDQDIKIYDPWTGPQYQDGSGSSGDIGYITLPIYMYGFENYAQFVVGANLLINEKKKSLS